MFYNNNKHINGKEIIMFNWLINLFSDNDVDNQAWRTEQATEWNNVRDDVLERDNFTCQNPACNAHRTPRMRKLKSKRIILAVHHINDASNNLDRIFDMSNLTTLCHGKGKCHNRFHKWMGGFDKPCNDADLERWYFIEKAKKDGSLLIWISDNLLISVLLFFVLISASIALALIYIS